MIALYRVKYENWSPSAAYAEWVQHGHHSLARLVTGALDRYYYRKLRALGIDTCDEVLKK
jgi:hypothetical protein